MAEDRDRPHIRVVADDWRSSEEFTSYGGGGASSKPAPPESGRPSHGKTLHTALRAASEAADAGRKALAVEVADANPGTYLEFESFPGLDLAIESLGNARATDSRRHIEVVAVPPRVPSAAPSPQRAAIFVPDGELEYFLRQLQKYSKVEQKAAREVRHENTYDRVATVKLAVLRTLWTDDDQTYPTEDHEAFWWEVWLRRTDGLELQRLHDFATHVGADVAERRLLFDDRIVTLVRTSPAALAGSLLAFGDVAELRGAKDPPSFFTGQSTDEQSEWVNAMADLVVVPDKDGDAPAVCVLDTGVNGGHPLLESALAPEDCHTCDPSWGVDDREGHGTEMAGLALYGDLAPLLGSSSTMAVGHRLESVKILPPGGSNPPQLYAAVTAESVNRPEVGAPERRRVFSMAVTATDSRDRGQPTSWSAAVDALAGGRSFDSTNKGLRYLDDRSNGKHRLFVISAGNVQVLELDHVARSDTEPVHDPAQAWNALTVGAHTEKVVIQDQSWSGWDPLAPQGELSPWSTTSTVFQPAWPIKPEVVVEGGNVVHDAAGNIDFPCDDLCVLTTYYQPTSKPLVTSWATSAATAQLAGLCATILSSYPSMWAETVRGLVVHSANWTDRMWAAMGSASGRTQRGMLLRRYGWGVPSLERALRSAANAATLLVEDVIHPFRQGKMREIHVYKLPWPRQALLDLGEAEVRIRVTLSYFVEPNPARRGWKTRHRYQSHGLRFELKGPTETFDDLRKRLNKKAKAESELRPRAGDANDGWFLGPRARDRGSIHSDSLTGTAAELAERGAIAVYPVSGWWKELKKRDRSEFGARYSLIVSIETDVVDADVWTPIAQEVGVPIEIET